MRSVNLLNCSHHFPYYIYIYWRRQWHPTPVLLPGKSHGWRSLVGWWGGVAKSQTWLSDFTFTFHFHALEKEMATHSSILTWRIPGMGSHRVGHDWSDLAVAVAVIYNIQLKTSWGVGGGGALSAPFGCLCQKLSLPPLYFNKTLLHKSSEWSSLVSGPGLNLSPPEAKNPGILSFSNNLSGVDRHWWIHQILSIFSSHFSMALMTDYVHHF